MIRAQELRIGNKFKSIFGNTETVLSIIDNTDKGKIKVCADCSDDVPHYKSENHREAYSHLILCYENGNQYKPCEISGEPLTEEWLLNMGFEKDANSHWEGSFLSPEFSGSRIRLLKNKDGFVHLTSYKQIELPCVHSLQNLFYVLSGGTELTIVNK